jgi:hypothetical protein
VPVYAATVFSRPAREQLRFVPEGAAWRIVPPHAPADAFALDAVLERHLEALRRLRGARASEHRGHPWSGDLVAAATAPSWELRARLLQAGRAADVARLDGAVAIWLGGT